MAGRAHVCLGGAFTLQPVNCGIARGRINLHNRPVTQACIRGREAITPTNSQYPGHQPGLESAGLLRCENLVEM